MATRSMTPTEKSCSRLEKLLLAASWGAKRFQRLSFYVPKLIVILPEVTDVLITKTKVAAPRIQARMIELDSIGCSY